MADVNDINNAFDKVIPIEEEIVVQDGPTDDDVEVSSDTDDLSEIEVVEQPMLQINISSIPGAPADLPDIMVAEEDPKEEKVVTDEDAAKTKKKEKWDWASKGGSGFIEWVRARINDTPPHSGYDTAGLERAIAYLEKIDAEISKAMRTDTDGELDANQIEAVRKELENGIDRLEERLDKIKVSKKRKKKAAILEPIVKEAGTVGMHGSVISVPLLISRIARVCINGTISTGKSTEDLFYRQVNKFKLNEREKAEVIQHMADLGFPLRTDRGFNEDEDIVADEGMDFATNYRG